MSEVRVKKRTGKPKSRGGCNTCKIRHVKCDETRPQCLRCVKFEIECDGYEIRKKETRAKRSTAPVLLPKLAGNQPLMPPSLIRLSDGTRLLPTATPFQPSTSLHFEKQSELLYFMTFQDRAAVELSGYFDTNIWKRTFLQLCHEEEFARHGITAIGALHTAMELIQGNGGVLASSKTQRKLGEHHHCIALQHYAKALKLMRDLPDRGGHAWLRHILLSCLLTACFENYIGNIESSMKAAQMGVDILIERGTPGEQGKSEEDLSHIIHNRSLDINDLLATFARLESYIMMFSNARGGHRRLRLSQVEGLASFREIPERFKTVQEARMHTDFFVKHALTWRDILLQLSNYSTLDIAEPDPAVRAQKIEELSQRAKREFGICVKTKQKWIKAFEPVYQASRASPGSKEYLGASILMIQYISSNLMTHLPGQNSEVIFDRMILDHSKVVNLAQDLLENYPCSSSKKAVFTFDDGLVPALFLVGTRCRDRTVRRQAIRMMIDYPRREALWDSTVAASIAVWLMNKEEEGIVDGYVPESSRLRISKMDVRYTEKKAIIGYSKWDEASKQRIEMGDVEFRWQGADNRNLETSPTLSTIN